MKKVLFIITKSNWGGAQRYVFDIATGIPKESFQAVVAAGNAQNEAGPGMLLEKLKRAAVRTVFIPSLQRDMRAGEWSSYTALSRLIRDEKPDVVHLNSSKAGGLGALAARRRKVPRIVFTVHGWAFRERRNPLSRLLIYFASLATVMLSHTVICVSEFDARPFRRLFPGKIVVVPNAVRETVIPLGKDAARAQLMPGGGAAAHSGEIWVGSVGELTPNKNFRTALTAIAKARAGGAQIFYAVIGDGEERGALTSLAGSIGLSGAVRFLGFVPDAQRFLPAFDILLMPSRKEGLPYVLIEAANVPLPVVASNAGALPEIIEHMKTGVICRPRDARGFARAIQLLASDEGLRKRFSEALKAKIASLGTFDDMIKKTAALY